MNFGLKLFLFLVDIDLISFENKKISQDQQVNISVPNKKLLNKLNLISVNPLYKLPMIIPPKKYYRDFIIFCKKYLYIYIKQI